MSILDGIFGGKKSFRQSDNMGIFHNSPEISSEYWLQRNSTQNYEPFLLYKFSEESDAVNALLDIDCIKIAEDTEEIICTEALIYGYYPVQGGEYEVVLCGEGISRALFINAKKSFIKNKGIKLKEKEPDATDEDKKHEQVKFFKEKSEVRSGHTYTYRIYKGPNAKAAVTFLEENPVEENLLNIIVETPEGNYGRNNQGIFKQ